MCGKRVGCRLSGCKDGRSWPRRGKNVTLHSINFFAFRFKHSGIDIQSYTFKHESYRQLPYRNPAAACRAGAYRCQRRSRSAHPPVGGLRVRGLQRCSRTLRTAPRRLHLQPPEQPHPGRARGASAGHGGWNRSGGHSHRSRSRVLCAAKHTPPRRPRDCRRQSLWRHVQSDCEHAGRHGRDPHHRGHERP